MRTELVKPQVPASARRACAAPVALPDRDMNAAEVTSVMGQDRAALRACETRRAAAIAAIDGALP